MQDAAQACEMVTTGHINAALEELFSSGRKLCKCSKPTVQVMRAAKSHVEFGGHVQDKLNDPVIFQFLFQRNGIPIGGPASGAVL
eukprot:1634739-Pyramimonas_sp.AAC.1